MKFLFSCTDDAPTGSTARMLAREPEARTARRLASARGAQAHRIGSERRR